MSTKDTVSKAIAMIAQKFDIEESEVSVHNHTARNVVELVFAKPEGMDVHRMYALQNNVKAHLAPHCTAVTTNVIGDSMVVFGLSTLTRSQTMPVSTLLNHIVDVANKNGTEVYTDLRRMVLEIEVDVVDMENMQGSAKPFTERLNQLGVDYNIYSMPLAHSRPHGRRMVMAVKTDLSMLVNLRQPTH